VTRANDRTLRATPADRLQGSDWSRSLEALATAVRASK